tara:strand:- start:4299 stop:5225 length:927 start_codon:yes stop_codon:yes gene_type:complete
MTEEQVLDTPPVQETAKETHSVDLQEEGSLVDDVIFGGESGSIEEAFDTATEEVAAPQEQVEEPIQATEDNDQVRYQYWQSEADKLKNQNEVLMQQLQQQQQVPQVQPQQEPAAEPEPEFPDPPERPQKPYNFNMEEAMADPSSESARFVQQEESWRNEMDEYKNMQFDYQMAMLQDERESMQQERQADIQRKEAEVKQTEQVNNVKQHVMSQYKVDENTANDFVKVMSDPNSISLDNLWKLYSTDKGYSSPTQPAVPSKEFQQVQRAQQVPPSMGVMPSQNRQNEGSIEDKIMDSMLTDYGKQNPFD